MLKKRVLSLLLVLISLCGMLPIVYAENTTRDSLDAAYILYDLGLFKGVGVNANGTPNFDLGRAPTRYEAVTMLVRLLGKEEEAKARDWNTPFTDVTTWAKPYVGYAYANGLTNGTGASTFGGDSTVSAAQFITFELRALGYSSDVDFKWNAPWELADQIGLTNGEYSADNNSITRGGVAVLSVNALEVKLKGCENKLFEKLIDEDVFSKNLYAQAVTGDCAEEVVIDINAFIDERNTAHKSILDTVYDESWFMSFAPSFSETLDLVSEEEADLLLNSHRGNPSDLISKEAALRDVDLLFRVYESFYGPYYFFGGNETFYAAKDRIIEEINKTNAQLTLEELSTIIIMNLSFVLDRHMDIGEYAVCEYNQIAVHNYYIKDLYFYEVTVGYYTKLDGKKWYISTIGIDTNIGNYLKVTVDEKGQLCYMPILVVPSTDLRREVDSLILTRGTNKIKCPITWVEFSQRKSYTLDEIVTVKNGIPLLEVEFNLNGSTSGEEQEEQQERLRRMGADFLSQDVCILDADSGCGWQSLFDSINHEYVDLSLYRLSNIADYLGRWNMPWGQGEIGQYFIRYFRGQWGKNDTLIFAVQDRGNFSASEGTIADIRAIENVITIGGNTGGSAGPSGATNQGMVLPNTGLYIHFGATLSIVGGYTDDGFCLEPDIWVDPVDAAEAAYRICEFYQISNSGNTSDLQKLSEQYVYEGAVESPENAMDSTVPENMGRTTQFQYDLDGDGENENYVFGLAFKGMLEGEFLQMYRSTYGYTEGAYRKQALFPCVWRILDNGELEVATEFSQLLDSPSTTIRGVTVASESLPEVQLLRHDWSGGIQITYPTVYLGVWLVEASASINAQTLAAAIPIIFYEP